jgi:ABC-type uncharacterized transport system ATPase subunit
VAVDGVTLRLDGGEVHAVLGENGAGKTTLMRIAMGLYQPDEGEILVDGRPQVIGSPRAARELGIAMVHQHSTLVGTLTVAENFVFGERTGRRLVDTRPVARRIAELSSAYGLEVDPLARVEDLSLGRRQRVEILRALHLDARTIVLDEPTATLTIQETERLFEVMRRLASEGRAIVFITHKFRELYAIADRVTVLRRGRVTGSLPVAGADRRDLTRMMVGDAVPQVRRAGAAAADGEVAVEAEDVWTGGPEPLRGLSLAVRFGETVGIAGVEGNGQGALAEALVGLRGAERGGVRVLGSDIAGLEPDEVAALGVGFVPDDRHDGLVLDMSVAENLVLRGSDRARFSRRRLLDNAAIRAHGRTLIERFSVAARDPGQPARTLSGGNQQKVILARELSREPRVVVAAQPTRGLDIAATAFVHQQLHDARGRGAAIVYISSDLDEILDVADRVAVIVGGRIVGVLDAGEDARERIGLLMAGDDAEPEA